MRAIQQIKDDIEIFKNGVRLHIFQDAADLLAERERLLAAADGMRAACADVVYLRERLPTNVVDNLCAAIARYDAAVGGDV